MQAMIRGRVLASLAVTLPAAAGDAGEGAGYEGGFKDGVAVPTDGTRGDGEPGVGARRSVFRSGERVAGRRGRGRGIGGVAGRRRPFRAYPYGRPQ